MATYTEWLADRDSEIYKPYYIEQIFEHFFKDAKDIYKIDGNAAFIEEYETGFDILVPHNSFIKAQAFNFHFKAYHLSSGIIFTVSKEFKRITLEFLISQLGKYYKTYFRWILCAEPQYKRLQFWIMPHSNMEFGENKYLTQLNNPHTLASISNQKPGLCRIETIDIHNLWEGVSIDDVDLFSHKDGSIIMNGPSWEIHSYSEDTVRNVNRLENSYAHSKYYHYKNKFLLNYSGIQFSMYPIPDYFYGFVPHRTKIISLDISLRVNAIIQLDNWAAIVENFQYLLHERWEKDSSTKYIIPTDQDITLDTYFAEDDIELDEDENECKLPSFTEAFRQYREEVN